MAEVKKIKVDQGVEGVVRPMPLIKLPKSLHKQLEGWITETMPTLLTERKTDLHRRQKWMTTLRGKRSDPAIARDASNMSVPLTIWVSSNTRARQIEGIFNIPPFVTARPLGGQKDASENSQAALKVATDLQKFLEAEVRNPLALNGFAAGEKIITEKTNYGTSALKVYLEPDKVLLAPLGKGVDVIRGRPRWAYVSFEDLIYWDGYGTDTQIMPYVGHEFTRTWAEMLLWVELGYYEKSAIDEVKTHFTDNKPGRQNDAPVTVIEHNIAELYLNFPTTVRKNDDGSETIGMPAALIVDYHMKAQKILRVTWNMNRRGVRPIFIDQFDVNPDPRKLQGQGVCEKLEGAQDETDAVHNIGIEAGKLAAAHLIGLKMGSQAEKDLGGGDPIISGDTYASEDPDEDVVTKPLGDPQAAVVAVQLEEHTRQYVMRMFGFDEGSLGDTTAGKRVPASLGLSIQREGKIPTSHSLSKSSDMYTQAMYLTIDLYRQVLPQGSLVAAVGAEAAEALMTTVFSVADVDSRDQFIINVTAQDASTINEQRKNELMMMTQFLFGFYDKLVQTGMLAAQVPQEFQPLLVDIIEKIQNSVRLLLSNIESIQNPEEVIPEVAEALRELAQISQGVSGGAPTEGLA